VRASYQAEAWRQKFGFHRCGRPSATMSARRVCRGCDLVDVSAGQTVADQRPVYGRMFQVQFADAIRNRTDIGRSAGQAARIAEKTSSGKRRRFSIEPP
jgi:hypothetical protein